MGFLNEGSNPFGSNNFRELYTDEDLDHMRGIIKIVEQLTNELDVNKDIIKFSNYDTSRKLISVGVDGGSQEIFPFINELSSSIIRIGADSKDLNEELPSFIQVIKYTKFSSKFYRFEDPNKTDDEIRKIVAKELDLEMNKIFNLPIMKRFTELTGIEKNDLGTSFQGDLQTFTNVIRNILEWSYIVNLSDKLKFIKVLILKDGRLEQHGVEESFRDKLKSYFERNKTYIVGVLKQNAIFKEGISNWVINNWVSELEEPFYFKAPQKIMEFVYANQRQWNPDFNKTFVFGQRYFGKLFGKTFHPMQSMLAFDIPFYFSNSQKDIHEIASTLFSHKSLLYNGSISTVSDAHAKASISNKVVREIERDLEQRLGIKLPKMMEI